MSNNIEYYLKSLDRRWKQEVKQVKDRLLIFSPYLSSKTAETIVETLENPELCEIYTIFSIKNFIVELSSLKTLKKLNQRGFKLFHLSRLNANIILVPNSFISIGSQSLTSKGVKNKEASIITTDPIVIQKLSNQINLWTSERSLITLKMLEEAEIKMYSFRRKFCSLQREANQTESIILENETRRQQEYIVDTMLKIFKVIDELLKILEQELILSHDKNLLLNDQELKQKISQVKTKVLKIAEHEIVDLKLAKECIRESAYWYDHPCGHPVQASGHSKHIYGDKNNWMIDFGANTFLVGHAICRCQSSLLNFLDELDNGYIIPITELKKRLKLDVRGAVANYDGYEYDGYYSGISGNYMKFGSQAINLDSFIRVVFDKVNLSFIFRYLNDQYPKSNK